MLSCPHLTREGITRGTQFIRPEVGAAYGSCRWPGPGHPEAAWLGAIMGSCLCFPICEMGIQAVSPLWYVRMEGGVCAAPGTAVPSFGWPHPLALFPPSGPSWVRSVAVCVERWPQVEEKAGRAQKQVVLGTHPGGPARS